MPNNKHPLTSNSEDYGHKTHLTVSEAGA